MPLKTISRIRERINLKLYGSKPLVLIILRTLSVMVSIVAMGSIIYYYGFHKTPESIFICSFIIKASFAFYILRFFVRVFFDFNPGQFIKSNWFEALLMVFLIINGIAVEIFGVNVFAENGDAHVHGMSSFSILLIQVYFFVIFMIDIGKASQNIGILNMGPSALLSSSFVILILAGAGLLCLPEMTTNHSIRFIDSLFTSCSACCVTGLVVVDTATFFTLKGKIIIMLLIQFGGLNIITFATYFATFYRKSGIKYQSLMKDMLSADRISDTRHILRDIIVFSLIMEAIGTVSLFFFWGDAIPFKDDAERFFFSMFHTISAFNNAGFALFTNNLYEEVVRHCYGVHLTIAALIFFGGLGFGAMQDLFGPRSIRDRMRFPWKKLRVNTKVALYTSLILVAVGAVFFYILEKDNTVDNTSLFGQITSSIFQSVTTRTAGFNTVDFAQLGQPILFIMIVLMFIGASPGSTGGGIKTTTFAMLFKSAIATIRGKKNVEIFKHTISFDLIDRAYSVLLFALTLVLFSTFLLTITEPGVDFIKLLFEEVSAFATVGLSTGITPFLTDASKYILIMSMFIGRVGPLTLVLSLTRAKTHANYKYSNANILIG
ncbi:MAG: potassium transporter TrkG [Bacteroidota bacterium]